jgi:ribokinase
MPEILVVGSLNADLVVRTPRFPQPGETISGEDLQVIPGGKGANQAVAAARHGARVSMLGRVGADSFGDFLLNTLRANHVDIQHVRRDDASTGTAVIIVDAAGQNSIVLSAGSNGNVSAQDVSSSFSDFSSLPTDAGGSPKLLLLQLEIPTPAVLAAIQHAHEEGMRVILNPAPAKPIPEELISAVDYLMPNETELSLLTEVDVTDIPSAAEAATSLLVRGVSTVIVTLGSRGALIVSNEQVTHIESFPIHVVDTTAAGDAFIGGFAYKLLESASSPANSQKQAAILQNAVRYGCACGALAATKFGAQPSLPTKEEVEKFLAGQSVHPSQGA